LVLGRGLGGVRNFKEGWARKVDIGFVHLEKGSEGKRGRQREKTENVREDAKQKSRGGGNRGVGGECNHGVKVVFE